MLKVILVPCTFTLFITVYKNTYIRFLNQVEQRRKEALSRTGDEGESALDSSLQDVVSRYSFMDLWPCSSKDLDHLTRQEVYHVLCLLCIFVLWSASNLKCQEVISMHVYYKYFWGTSMLPLQWDSSLILCLFVVAFKKHQ